MDLYGGSRSSNWQTPLLNEVRSYSRSNDYRLAYQSAVGDELWVATMQRLASSTAKQGKSDQRNANKFALSR